MGEWATRMVGRRESESEFDAFVAGATPRLLRDAYACTGDWHEARDLVQEAFVRTYRAWRRIRSDEPYAYARTTLVRVFVDQQRRARTTREIVSANLPERVAADVAIDTRIDLMTALARLPRQQRAIVVLRYLEDLSTARTAEALNITEGTVKSQLSAALQNLREATASDVDMMRRRSTHG